MRPRQLALAARAWLAMASGIAPEFLFVVWGAALLLDSGFGPAAASAAAVALLVLALHRREPPARTRRGRATLRAS